MLTWFTIKRNDSGKLVLILILMECSLGKLLPMSLEVKFSLNPYSNGMLTWIELNPVVITVYPVLILILMECSLGGCNPPAPVKPIFGLNPYSNGMLTWISWSKFFAATQES